MESIEEMKKRLEQVAAASAAQASSLAPPPQESKISNELQLNPGETLIQTSPGSMEYNGYSLTYNTHIVMLANGKPEIREPKEEKKAWLASIPKTPPTVTFTSSTSSSQSETSSTRFKFGF